MSGMENETTTTAYEEYLAHQEKLKTADIYERCKRCGKLTESFYPYCARCQRQTGRGDKLTFSGRPDAGAGNRAKTPKPKSK